VNQLLVQEIWQRARNRCEYCRIPHPHYRLPFQVDHIIARQHGGSTTLDNLALACFHCNRFKGPNIAGLDPASKDLVRLFHPRLDLWTDHFQFEHARLVGLTPIGRATIQVLAMNAEDLLLFRVEILQEGATFT
jgi:HNH endonuclease